jgi:hypothetical protein
LVGTFQGTGDDLRLSRGIVRKRASEAGYHRRRRPTGDREITETMMHYPNSGDHPDPINEF